MIQKECFIIVKKKNFCFDSKCIEEIVGTPIYHNSNYSLQEIVNRYNELIEEENKIVSENDSSIKEKWKYLVKNTIDTDYSLYYNKLCAFSLDPRSLPTIVFLFLENFENENVKIMILEDEKYIESSLMVLNRRRR